MEHVSFRCATRCRVLLTSQRLCNNSNRHFSITPCYQRAKKRYYIKKAPNFYEAGRADRYNRTDVQRLFNLGFKNIPFNSKFPVTAKHTGPQNEGGSEEAAKYTALHGKHNFIFLAKSVLRIFTECHNRTENEHSQTASYM